MDNKDETEAKLIAAQNAYLDKCLEKRRVSLDESSYKFQLKQEVPLR